MNQKFYSFVIALISAMLLAFTVSSSWAVWTVDITVTSDDGALPAKELTFGTDTSVANVPTTFPPPPVTGNYVNAAFYVPPFTYYSTYTNANGPWLLRIKTNVGFTLAWNTADLAAIPDADGIYHVSSALDSADNPRLDWELLRNQPSSKYYPAGNYFIRITKILASTRTASLVSGERIAFQGDSLSTGAAIELVSGPGGNVTVTRNDTVPPDVQGLPYHWVITPVSGSQVKLRFYYNDADLDRDENKYRLAYKDGSEWNIVTNAVHDLNKNYFETPQIDHTSTWGITFAEVTPPEIVYYSPPDGSIISVAPLTITVQFSEEMDKKSVLQSRFTRTNVTDGIIEIEADLCTFLQWFGYPANAAKYNSYGCVGPYGIVKADQFDLSFNTAGDTLTINTEVEIDAPGTPIMLPNKEYRLSIVLNKAMDLAGNLLTLLHLDYTYYTEVQSVTDLIVKISGDYLDLSWSAITSMTYDVYRDTIAYFNPDTVNKTNQIASGIPGSQPTVTFTDNNIGGADVVGDVNNNYFYVVITVDGGGNMSGISNRVGEYDVGLKSTPKTDWNLMAGPVGGEDITKASELQDAIPNANAVAYWDAASQGYFQYVPGIEPTNFPVILGYPYYVNVTADAIWTTAGALTTPVFELITTAKTDWNTITVPLDKVDITKASELQTDIPNCNAVAYWDAASQGYFQYVPGIEPTNFPVRVGRAYYVNVTVDVIWPESSLQASPAKELLSNRGQLSNQIFGTPPHIVYGVVETSEGSIPKASELTITAFIKDRPSDILTYDIPQNPGTPVKIDYKEENGIWLVQIGGFEGRWSQGEMLRIDFHDKSGGQSGYHEVVLSDEPVQNLSGKVLRLSAPVPKQSALLQNYPNPFNPETWIPYKLSHSSDVTITIYNIQGQLVRALNLGHREAGFYVSKESAAYWNGRNDTGEKVASGIYFYQINAGTFNATKRLVILK